MARVTGLDLAPVLTETAKERAVSLGLEIEYVVGHVEQLSFGDASFDKVSSTLGIMFSPDHEAAARELARVAAPVGRIELASWTPTGGLARASFCSCAGGAGEQPPLDAIQKRCCFG
jgi:ubiquinone/menaquinone biosynthesis C-methylase UbiE